MPESWGQIAYEAWRGSGSDASGMMPWVSLPVHAQERWEQVAQVIRAEVLDRIPQEP